MLAVRARDNVCWIAFVNAVGGQDELVFDGHSLVLDQDGEVAARAPAFEEALLVVDIDPTTAVGHRLRDARRRALARELHELPDPAVIELGLPHALDGRPARALVAPPLDELEEMRRALELGLSDYVEKNGFREVVLGISGGIDSALTAVLAVEALGSERVICVSMPSRYSSEGTKTDARRVAERLGVRLFELPIETIVEAFAGALDEAFAGTAPGLAEENVQARIRGVLLMALSNKFGWLVVATGNKSEYSVGYATLYGDMAGGFALLKDVYKTDVFRLARYLNERAGRGADPEVGDRARAERGAARRPARRGLAASLRGARPRARGVRRARPLARGALTGRIRGGRRRAGARAHRQGGVQAAPGAARRQAAAEGLRPRPAAADHEPLVGLETPATPPPTGRPSAAPLIRPRPGANDRPRRRRPGCERPHPCPPGGVQVGIRREASGELELHHPVGEGPHRPRAVGIAAGGTYDRRGRARFEPFGQAITRERPLGREPVEVWMGERETAIGAPELLEAADIREDVRDLFERKRREGRLELSLAADVLVQRRCLDAEAGGEARIVSASGPSSSRRDRAAVVISSLRGTLEPAGVPEPVAEGSVGRDVGRPTEGASEPLRAEPDRGRRERDRPGEPVDRVRSPSLRRAGRKRGTRRRAPHRQGGEEQGRKA